MDDRPEIEDQPEPVEAPVPPVSEGVPWGGIIATIGLILVVVFAVQNTDTVPVDFLWIGGEFPLAVVILVTFVSSVLFALIAGGLYRRRRLRMRAEKQEWERLRGQD